MSSLHSPPMNVKKSLVIFYSPPPPRLTDSFPHHTRLQHENRNPKWIGSRQHSPFSGHHPPRCILVSSCRIVRRRRRCRGKGDTSWSSRCHDRCSHYVDLRWAVCTPDYRVARIGGPHGTYRGRKSCKGRRRRKDCRNPPIRVTNTNEPINCVGLKMGRFQLTRQESMNFVPKGCCYEHATCCFNLRRICTPVLGVPKSVIVYL